MSERGKADSDCAVEGGETELRRTVTAYAELVRVPNLFTAPPDVLLGAALVAAAGHRVPALAVGGLALASMALYAGGTTLNDAFDAPADALERPERPIPSGRVDRRVAFVLGFAFLLFGIALGFAAVGEQSGFVAGLIALSIAAYDGALKGTPAGFLAMGATRGLNVALGTTTAAMPPLERSVPAVVVSVTIAAYIATVTYMASHETEGENRGAVATAGVGGIAGVFAVGWHLSVTRPPVVETALSALLAGAFLWWIGRPLEAAYRDPIPETVGPAVGACVVGLVLLDAAFAAAAGLEWAIAIVAFLVPARLFSRAFDVT